jgi:MarR family transcriptional regulator, 2-MHQ and catechol-resistance regulon repressor
MVNKVNKMRMEKLDQAVETIFVTMPMLFKTILHNPEALGHDPMSSEFRLVAVVSRHGSMAISRIADFLNVSKPNMTKLVDKLIEEGKIKRVSDLKDRRVTKIEITDVGVAYMENCMDSAKHYAKKKLSALTPQELDTLYNSLDNLLKILNKMKEEKNI